MQIYEHLEFDTSVLWTEFFNCYHNGKFMNSRRLKVWKSYDNLSVHKWISCNSLNVILYHFMNRQKFGLLGKYSKIQKKERKIFRSYSTSYHQWDAANICYYFDIPSNSKWLIKKSIKNRSNMQTCKYAFDIKVLIVKVMCENEKKEKSNLFLTLWRNRRFNCVTKPLNLWKYMFIM